MKITKFGSLNLDTPRISYEFYKFSTIFGKQIKKNIKTLINAKCTWRTAPKGADSWVPRSE